MVFIQVLFYFLISITALSANINQSTEVLVSSRTPDHRVIVKSCLDNSCKVVGRISGYSKLELSHLIPQYLEKKVLEIQSNQLIGLVYSSALGGISMRLGKVALTTLTSMLAIQTSDHFRSTSDVIESLNFAKMYIPILASEDFQLPSLLGHEYYKLILSIQSALESYDYYYYCETNVKCRREIVSGMNHFESLSDSQLMKYPVSFLKIQKHNHDNYINALQRHSLK